MNDREFSIDICELIDLETNSFPFGHCEQNERVSEYSSSSIPATSSEEGEIGYIGPRRRLLSEARGRTVPTAAATVAAGANVVGPLPVPSARDDPQPAAPPPKPSAAEAPSSVYVQQMRIEASAAVAGVAQTSRGEPTQTSMKSGGAQAKDRPAGARSRGRGVATGERTPPRTPAGTPAPPRDSRIVFLRFDANYEEIISKVPIDQTIDRIAQSSICPVVTHRLREQTVVICEVERVQPGSVIVTLRLSGDTHDVTGMIRDIMQMKDNTFFFQLGAERIELRLIECTETPPIPAASPMPPSNERHIGNPAVNDKANNEQFDGQKYTSEEQMYSMYVVGVVGVVLFTCVVLVAAGIVGYFLFVKPNAPNPTTDPEPPKTQPKKKQNRLKRRFSRLDDSLWKGTPRGEAVLARRRKMEKDYGDWDL